MNIQYGTIKLESMKYIIKEYKIKRKWWFGYKSEFWIETEYSRIGPFSNISEAREVLAWGHITEKEIEYACDE